MPAGSLGPTPGRCYHGPLLYEPCGRAPATAVVESGWVELHCCLDRLAPRGRNGGGQRTEYDATGTFRWGEGNPCRGLRLRVNVVAPGWNVTPAVSHFVTNPSAV